MLPADAAERDRDRPPLPNDPNVCLCLAVLSLASIDVAEVAVSAAFEEVEPEGVVDTRLSVLELLLLEEELAPL